MKCEYLLFHLIVLAGPVLFSFERRVRYVTHWPRALLAAFVVMIPYVIWDALVTNRHWSFVERRTIGLSLAGLPVEEWLFFVTVPFASLFVWENVCSFKPLRQIAKRSTVQIVGVSTILAGALIYPTGEEYTALALIALGVVVLLDGYLRADLLLQSRTYMYLAFVTGFMLVFNGYLTARPIVIYHASYQLGIHVGTIPVEDFAYGYGLLLADTIVYEKLKGIGGG